MWRDGCFKIIYDLSLKLTAYAKEKNIIIEASQVKEKYGTLSFYLNYNDNFTTELVDSAQRFFLITCEVCGKSGEINTSPWYSVRCSGCKGERKNKWK